MTEPVPSAASVSQELHDPPVPDFDLNVRHWALAALLEHWRQAHRGNALPRRADISPAQFGRAMPYVSMIDVAGEPPRYRWRLICSQVTRRLGRDLTGKWFDEIYPPAVVERLGAVYGLSLQHRVAIRFCGTMAFAGKSHLPYESVHMPLVNDEDRIVMLMIGVHLGRQH